MVYTPVNLLVWDPTLGHSNWIISFPLLEVTTSMQAGGLLLLSYYLPDI